MPQLVTALFNLGKGSRPKLSLSQLQENWDFLVGCPLLNPEPDSLALAIDLEMWCKEHPQVVSD